MPVRKTLLSAALSIGLLAVIFPAAMASAPRRTAVLDRALVAELQRGGANVSMHAATGMVRFVGGSVGRPVATNAELGRPTTAKAAARRFMGRYGSTFGVRDVSANLHIARTVRDGTGRTFIRYQQLHRGVPVLGGDLIVQVDAGRNVISANGEASPDLTLDVRPRVSAAGAIRTARAAIAKGSGMQARDLSVTTPKLWVYDPALMGGRALPFARLVWRMDVTSRDADFREFVLVDAERDVVALRFDQTAHARNRIVCDAKSSTAKYPCLAFFDRVEGGPDTGNPDIDDAYKFSGDTFDFYMNRFNRNSLDNLGMSLISTVRYCPTPSAANCPYKNAFWSGTPNNQMVYGSGYASADDVVGHELTHGVTDFESGLFYYYQSGAINEALSDIFGEFMDLTNGNGTDTATTRWQIGEDLPPSTGVIRDMEDPTLFGDPDSMQSPFYDEDFDESDRGGVHANSGVANKAAFLMVDGGTLNFNTVTGIGIDKAAAIWYRVNTSLLGSASDYADLGAALNQACTDLLGQQVKDSAGALTGTIVPADCTEVSDAVLATQMALQPTTTGTSATHAPICSTGTPSNVLLDQIGNLAPGWGTSGASGRWFYGDFYATSDPGHLYGDDPATTGQASILRTSATVIPANAFLHFNHAYGFEDGSQYLPQPDSRKFDGGVLEYSTSGTGGPWIDVGAARFTHNGYNGTISSAFSNPLAGREAFTSESHGYISSRVNLNFLSGQSVNFRFKIGTDSTGGDYGWFIDDFRIYTCVDASTAKPDGRIRIGTSGAFIGNDIYNTTATGQSVSKSAPIGSTIKFNISVQNDNIAVDSFTMLGGGSTTNYTVKYLDGATDITAAVIAGTYTTPSLAPGATRLITVKVKVKSSATVGSKVKRLVTITSVADNTKKDAVKFTGKRS